MIIDDPGELVCELQFVLRPLQAVRSNPGDHAQFARLQRMLNCLELKKKAEQHDDQHREIEPFIAALGRRKDKAYRKGDLLECAEIDTVIAHANALRAEAEKARAKIAKHDKAGEGAAAVEARKKLVALNKRFRGIDDDMISPEAKPAALGPDGLRSAHPDYPDLPTDYLRDWKYNHMINLDYPGLQLIYMSKVQNLSATPRFILITN